MELSLDPDTPVKTPSEQKAEEAIAETLMDIDPENAPAEDIQPLEDLLNDEFPKSEGKSLLLLNWNSPQWGTIFEDTKDNNCNDSVYTTCYLSKTCYLKSNKKECKQNITFCNYLSENGLNVNWSKFSMTE